MPLPTVPRWRMRAECGAARPSCNGFQLYAALTVHGNGSMSGGGRRAPTWRALARGAQAWRKRQAATPRAFLTRWPSPQGNTTNMPPFGLSFASADSPGSMSWGKMHNRCLQGKTYRWHQCRPTAAGRSADLSSRTMSFCSMWVAKAAAPALIRGRPMCARRVNALRASQVRAYSL